MPWQPRRPCPAPGCPRLLAPGQLCPEHRRQPFAGSTYRVRRAIPETLRREILRRDLYACQLCGAAAVVVDHIIPRAEGGSDDPSNLQALCLRCSAKKSSAEGGRAVPHHLRR